MNKGTQQTSERIEVSVGGSADADELNRRIAFEWRALVSDPQTRAYVGELLGVPEDVLDPEQPPFTAEVKKAGFAGAEVVIAVAVAFLVGLAKGAGDVAGKAAAHRLGELWSNRMRSGVSPPGTQILGEPRDRA